MTTTHQAIRVGLFVILGTALIWILYQALNEKRSLTYGSYTLRAPFEDIKQLKPGDEVRMAGVRIGSVQRTALEKGQAIALLSIDRNYSIPNDAEATIAMASLLGTHFVAVSLGSANAPPLSDGAVVKTVSTPDLNALFHKFASIGGQVKKFFGGSEQDQDTGFNKLSELIYENRKSFYMIIKSLEITIEHIVNSKGTLGKLINDDQAYQTFLQASENTNKLMTDVSELVADIKFGKGIFGSLIVDEQLAEDIEVTVANFRALSEKLNSGQGTLGRLIHGDDLYEEAQVLMQKAGRSLDNLSEAGLTTAVGVAANALF